MPLPIFEQNKYIHLTTIIIMIYMNQDKKNIIDETDPDWIYKPILKTNTHTDYDGNRINEEWMT
jgi:hypothetical protein